MFCSTCGVAIAKGLSFCNYCGARIPPVEAGLEFREVRPSMLVGAMAAVFVMGFPAIALFMLILNRALRLDPGQSIAFAWTSLTLMIALEAVFVLLLLRRKPRQKNAPEIDQVTGPQTKELDARHDGRLPEPVPSVTEHTTHSFDHILPERS